MLKNLKKALFGAALMGAAAAAFSPFAAAEAQDTVDPASVLPGVWAIGIDEDNCDNAEKWLIVASDGQAVHVGGLDVVQMAWRIEGGELSLSPVYGLHRDSRDWQPSSRELDKHLETPIEVVDNDHVQLTNKNDDSISLYRCAPHVGN